MRILTFTSLFPNEAEPGHGIFVSNRVRAMAQTTNLQVMAPVRLAPPVPGLPARYYKTASVARTESHHGLVVHHPRYVVIPGALKATDPILLAMSTAPAFLSLHRRFSFDVVDAHWACPDGVAAAVLARLVGVPFTVTVRGDDINVFAREPGRAAAIGWALRRAAAVIALSQELRDRVLELGVRESRVAVIANGVDTGRFQPIDREESRRKLGIAPSTRLLLSVGRIHQSKGFPVLVEALARLVPRFPELKLVIIGEPDHEADARPAIEAAIARGRLEGRVAMPGGRPAEELPWWYSAADLFCLATTREGSANVLLEAMACGIPSVTTDVGGNREAIADDRLGILTGTDADSISHAIETALHRRWNRDEIAARARSRRWDAVGHECCRVLRSIVATRTGPEMRRNQAI